MLGRSAIQTFFASCSNDVALVGFASSGTAFLVKEPASVDPVKSDSI
jgi:hypothetical protein